MQQERYAPFAVAGRLPASAVAELWRLGLLRGHIVCSGAPARGLPQRGCPGSSGADRPGATAAGGRRHRNHVRGRVILATVARELFNAMNTTDPDSVDKTRDFALISKTSEG